MAGVFPADINQPWRLPGTAALVRRTGIPSPAKVGALRRVYA